MIVAVLRWLLMLIADLTVFVLAWLLAPILPAFAIGKDHLPYELSYFDTPDNPLDGDVGYIMQHAPSRATINLVDANTPTTNTRLVLGRIGRIEVV